MKDIGIVTGSNDQAKPLIIGTDTVYVHTDIELVRDGDCSKIYKYHEVQYDKDEYIQLMSEKNTIMEEELTTTQLAICNIYESL